MVAVIKRATRGDIFLSSRGQASIYKMKGLAVPGVSYFFLRKSLSLGCSVISRENRRKQLLYLRPILSKDNQ